MMVDVEAERRRGFRGGAVAGAAFMLAFIAAAVAVALAAVLLWAALHDERPAEPAPTTYLSGPGDNVEITS